MANGAFAVMILWTESVRSMSLSTPPHKDAPDAPPDGIEFLQESDVVTIDPTKTDALTLVRVDPQAAISESHAVR